MKFYAILLSVLLAIACNQDGDNSANTGTAIPASAANDTSNYTSIQWLDSIQDIGVLTLGQNAEINFRFKNTGNKPLFIVSANPGCGCTVADYPKEAIAPGSEAVIKAGFDTKNQHIGGFYKSISVVTNTTGNVNHNLIFQGEIITGEQDAPAQEKKPKPVRNEPLTQ